MFEAERSPNFMGKVFPVPLCAPCGSSFLLVIESVSLPLIHHGQRGLALQITPQIFGEQRVMPLP